jgi:CRP-like cAMP-binding protein
MISKILVDALRRTEIFDGLSPMQITEIARHAERTMFQPNQVVARQGEQASGAILIIDGEMDCISGPLLMTRKPVEPGALLAEMAMFTEFEYGATFVARTPVKAMRISRDEMLRQMGDEPELAGRLLEKVAGRLREVAKELAAVGGLDLESVDSEDVRTATRRTNRQNAASSRSDASLVLSS